MTLATCRRRNVKIEFYVDEEELNKITEKAQVMHLDRSKYMRKVAVDGYIIKQDYSHLDDMIYELNKIGNNINQIAKVGNANNHISSQDIKEIKENMNKIWDMVADKM